VNHSTASTASGFFSKLLDDRTYRAGWRFWGHAEENGIPIVVGPDRNNGPLPNQGSGNAKEMTFVIREEGKELHVCNKNKREATYHCLLSIIKYDNDGMGQVLDFDPSIRKPPADR
jgi:hypothetical protein